MNETQHQSVPEARATKIPPSQIQHMQQHLATLLESIAQVKQNCSRLEAENKFIQEYITSLMNPKQ